jgi:hypothetical protein
MAYNKSVKPTKKNSPAVKVGRNPDNKPAESYAKPHKMSGASIGMSDVDLGVGYATDPNKLKSDEHTPGGMPAMTVSIGNKTRGPKTSGIETRGNGAATKGRIARGPMA